MGTGSFQVGPGTRVVARAIAYYTVLIGSTSLVWRFLPRRAPDLPSSLETLFGGGAAGLRPGARHHLGPPLGSARRAVRRCAAGDAASRDRSA